MFLLFHLLNNCQCIVDNRAGVYYRETGSERDSLLSHHNDDQSSQTSTYDSASQDDKDSSDGHVLGVLDGQLKDGEVDSNMRRLCAICFDAPKNSFFLPCGHCVACFACGTRQLFSTLTSNYLLQIQALFAISNKLRPYLEVNRFIPLLD